MSKTIEERVVSLKFDNKQFEQGTATTMSTIDKLKDKLRLTDASRGFESISNAAKKCNLTPLGSSIDAIANKFSAMEIMGITAIANLTNSVVNAGKNMVKSLTIDPVGGGFKEYELMLGAIKTTMSGTGKTAEEVEKELKKLDDYADKTIYSTADMLNNLPKFTNAGVELETATKAMIGIANATAHAGGDAGKASIAFYNLGQAIGTGYLSRMDYNSINNAGIATMKWKEAMVEAAIAEGTLTKTSDGRYKAGKQVLTLQQLFIDGLQEQWATKDVMLKVFGDYGDAETKIGKEAYDSAQKIKTFTMMMESLKATAETGWKDTWQHIFGGLNVATTFWTNLSNVISSVITGIADWRNYLIQGAMDFATPWKNIMDKIDGSGFGKVADAVENVTNKLEYFQDVVDKVWHGDFNNWGDTPDRRDLLKKAGYDPRVVQYLVNLGEESHKAGKKYKLTADDIAAAHKKYNITLDETTESTKSATKALTELSDTELKDNFGLTEYEIRLFRDLAKAAEESDKSIEALAKEMSEADGRTMLIDSFKNIGKTLGTIFGEIKNAWLETFPPVSIVGIYNLIKGFKELSGGVLEDVKSKSDELRRTFKGVFALFNIITTITAGPLGIALRLVGKALKACGFGFIDVTAKVGDAIVAFSEWLDKILNISGIVEFFAPIVQRAVEAVKGLVSALANSQGVKNFADALSKIKDTIAGWVDGIKNTDNVGQYIIDGLVKGLTEGVPKVIKAIVDVAVGLFNAFCDYLGIASPAKKLIDAAYWIIMGIVEGLAKFIPLVWSAITTVATSLLEGFKKYEVGDKIFDLVTSSFVKITEFIKGLDLGTVLAALFGAGGLIAIFKLLDIIKMLASPIDSIKGLLDGVKKSFVGLTDAIKDNMKAKEWKNRAASLLLFALAIAILAAAIIGLAYVIDKQGWNVAIAAGVILALMGGMIALASVLGRMKELDATQIAILSASMAGVAVSLYIMAMSIKALAEIPAEDIGRALLAFGGIFLALGGLFAALLGLNKLGVSKDLWQVGVSILAMSVAMTLVVRVMKQVSGMEPDAIKKGFDVVAGIGLIFSALIAATKLGGANAKQAGVSLILMAIAFKLMVGVIKSIEKLDPRAIRKGTKVISGISIIFTGLIAATKLGGQNASKAGSSILMMSFAMLLMVGIIKLIDKLDERAIVKGLGVIAALGMFFGGLMFMSKFAGKEAMKAGVMLLSMAGAMLILVGVIKIIGYLSVEEITKGLIVIGVLSSFMAGLMYMTKFAGAEDCSKTLIVLAVTISLLAIALFALSFIPDKKGLLAAAGSLAIVIGIFGALVYVTQYLEKVNFKKMLGPIITLTLVVAAMAGILIALSKLGNPDALIPSAVALGILATVMVGVLAILGVVGKYATKAGPGILALTSLVIPLFAFIGVLAVMQHVDVAISQVGALCILATAASILMLLLIPVGAFATQASTGALALTLMAIPLLAFVGVLALLQNVETSIGKVATLVALAASMTLLMYLLIPIGALAAPASLGALALTLTAVPLLAFVGVLALLQNVEVATDKVAALLVLAATMTLLMYLLIPIGALWIPAAIGLAALTASAIPLLAFVGVLAIMQHIENATTNVGLIVTLMTAMADVLVKISLVAPLAILAVTALTMLMGVIATMGLFVAAIAGLDALFNGKVDEFVNVAIPILVKMAGGLGEMVSAFMSGLCQDLPIIGELLSRFMMNAMPFIVGINLVGPHTLVAVGHLVGAILALTVADFINGLTSIATFGSSFADLGTQLSDFMRNALPFIAGMMLVTPSVVTGAKALADTILVLTGTSILDGLASLFNKGESPLAKFGSQLPQLGTDLANFAKNLNSNGPIDPAAVEAAAKALNYIASAAKNLPNEGGLLGAIVGENGIGAFVKQLPDVGTQMANFAKNLNTNGAFDKSKIETVQNGADALVAIAEAAKEIPNEGGLLGEIMGENGIGAFVKQLPDVGTNIAKFANNLANGGFTSDKVQLVTDAMSALKSVADVAKDLPNEGGWLGTAIGDNGLDVFADKLPGVGEDIASFAEKVKDIGDSKTAVETAVAALKSIVDVAAVLPSEGGWLSKLFGGDDENTLGNFGDKLAPLGEDLAAFSEKVKGISIDAVGMAAGAFKLIADGTANVPDDTSLLTAFADNLEWLGGKLETYFNTVGGISQDVISNASNAWSTVTGLQTAIDTQKMQGVSNSINNLVNTMKKVAEISTSDADGLLKSIQNLGNADFEALGANMVGKMIDGMNGLKDNAVTKAGGIMSAILIDIRDTKDYPGRFKTFGESLTTSIGSGIHDKVEPAKARAAGMMAVVLTHIRDTLDYPGRFKSLGISCATGFGDGISQQTWYPKAKAIAMANAAEKAAKEALDVNSPSKVFRKLGMSVPEGFAMGIGMMGSAVTGASRDMASTAINSVSKSISRIGDMVSSDIDAQPTIRPIMDLSDVRAGANTIGNLLNTESSIGVVANAGRIGGMMNRYSQNRGNDDVVAAIDKLNKRMDNLGNTTNIVNGITYDDGSNINNAVATLVRAAKIERRV